MARLFSHLIYLTFIGVSSTSTPKLVAYASIEPPSKKLVEVETFKNISPLGISGVAVKITSYPFVVSIREHDQFMCSGIILDSNMIISTAHCMNSKVPLQIYTVHVGRTKKYGVEAKEQVFKVIKVLKHPDFNRGVAYNNDIILIKLNATIKFNALAQPAKLPSANEILPANTYCCVVGWGNTLGYGHPNLLNEGCFPTWDIQRCNDSDNYDGRISRNMLCAGDENGIDACRGDSGGPLYCVIGQIPKVWGLVSWGSNLVDAHKPGVYVNLANYRKWIQQNSNL